MNARNASTFLPRCASRALVEAACRVDLAEQRGEQVDVGVGADRKPLAGAGRDRLDAARVHEIEFRAAALRLAQPLHRVGHREERAVRDARIGAEHEQEPGVVEIRDRVDRAGAKHRFAAGELVGAVLGARRKDSSHAELREERRDRRPRERVERGGISHVGRDRIGTVPIDDAAQLRSDGGECVVPARALEAAIAPSQRMIEAIRVAVHVGAGDALVAGEAARHGMLAIGRQRHERFALDARDEPQPAADAAEGGPRALPLAIAAPS
jgi:hypothetical protein